MEETINKRKKDPECPTVVPSVMRVSGESIRPSDREINSARDVYEEYEVIVSRVAYLLLLYLLVHCPDKDVTGHD